MSITFFTDEYDSMSAAPRSPDSPSPTSIAPDTDDEQVIWEGRTSWMDHALLYVLMSMAVVRGAVAVRAGDWSIALLYVVTVGTFMGLAAWFHYGTVYRVTTARVQVRSGWNGRVVTDIPLASISDVTLRYEPLNRWFDLGAVVLASRSTEDCCTIRGIPNAERVHAQLVRWIRARRGPWEPLTIHGVTDSSRNPRHAQ
ncbi:MAG: PH domain-containing protein [Nitrospiraceae bacterium]